jgi:hypothetical protein
MIFPDRAQLAAASTNPRDHLAAQGPERENLHAMRTPYQAAVDRADSIGSLMLGSGRDAAFRSLAVGGVRDPPDGAGCFSRAVAYCGTQI